MTASSTRTNLFWLLAIGVAWGATPSLARIVTQGGASPLGLTLWQALGGGLLLLIMCFARGRTLPLSSAHLAFYLFCGVTGTALPTTMLFVVAPKVPVGVLSMLLAAVPLMTYALSLVCGIDRFTAGRLFGLVLGLCAVGLLFVPVEDNTVRKTAWIVLTLLIPASYTLENIYVALRRPPACDEITLLAGMLLTSAAVLFPIVGLADAAVSISFPFGEVEWAMLAMIVVNVFSYAIFLYLISNAGPVFASQAGYTVMLCGVAWGIILFGEQHSYWVWGSFGLMLLGMAFVKQQPVVTAG